MCSSQLDPGSVTFKYAENIEELRCLIHAHATPKSTLEWMHRLAWPFSRHEFDAQTLVRRLHCLIVLRNDDCWHASSWKIRSPPQKPSETNTSRPTTSSLATVTGAMNRNRSTTYWHRKKQFALEDIRLVCHVENWRRTARIDSRRVCGFHRKRINKNNWMELRTRKTIQRNSPCASDKKDDHGSGGLAEQEKPCCIVRVDRWIFGIEPQTGFLDGVLLQRLCAPEDDEWSKRVVQYRSLPMMDNFTLAPRVLRTTQVRWRR